MEKNCIAPSDQLRCDMLALRHPATFADCNRYGQSILAVTILNKCNFSENCYADPTVFYSVTRKPTKHYNLQLHQQSRASNEHGELQQ